MITSPTGRLKRAVFGFNHETSNPTAINIAADLARRLQLDLLGLFVMDQMLDAALSYPEARELPAPYKDWSILDPNLLRQQQNLIANRFKRELQIKAQKEKLRTAFEVTTGRFEEVLKEFILQSDILILSESQDPLRQMTKSYSVMCEIAMRVPSSALIIPKSSTHRSGPVLAFLTHKDDPNLEVASSLARSYSDKLIIVWGDKDSAASEQTLLAQIQKSDPNLELRKMSLVVSSKHISNEQKNKLIAEMCRLINVPLLILETSNNYSSLPK